jgi:hypothetical protein
MNGYAVHYYCLEVALMETFHLTFERSLTSSDVKQNIPFPFQVPEGTTRIMVRLSYAPWVVDAIRNLLTLTVFDPSGWRGESHRGDNPMEILLAEDLTSPGYLLRPVQAGEWTVFLNTHMVREGATCNIKLEIAGTDLPVEVVKPDPKGLGDSPSGARSAKPLGSKETSSRGPGWYRGDIHAHTIHSDARWDVSGLVAYARARKLDFATLSDHNTIAGLAEMDANRSDDLLTMGGMELTTFWGHCLALGLREWVDWRSLPGGAGMEAVAADVTRRGGLFIIAHPKSVGDPLCTGCDWHYASLMPGIVNVVEVWNNDWYGESNSEDNLKLVYQWLNQGFKLAISAGTDNHGEHLDRLHLGFNVVYAEDLTESAILRAIRAGHDYLSSGPRLILEGSAGGKQVRMGDVLAPGPGEEVSLQLNWADAPEGAELELIVDGEAKECLPAAAEGTRRWTVQAGQSHWGLVTLREKQGRMLALTNPIFWDGRK